MQALDEVKELRKLWGGFWSSRVLLTANNLRVFDHLKAPATARELARTLKLDRRASEIVLDALTGLGLLKKSGDKYRNTPAANRFLVKGTPLYQGDILKHADTLWKNWSNLDAIVRTGKPNRSARDHSSFILGMHNIASLKAPEVIGELDLKGVKRALDLGGGPGTYSIELAKKGIAVTLFDMPETVKIAKGVAGKSGQKHIDFIKGDFTVDDIGKGYDLIFISQILHAFSVADSIRVIRKCKAALNPGGRIAIQEFYLARDRAHPVPGALFSVNMLVNTPGGRCYAPSEMKQWLTQAGFSGIKEKMLDDTVLVLGRTK